LSEVLPRAIQGIGSFPLSAAKRLLEMAKVLPGEEYFESRTCVAKVAVLADYCVKPDSAEAVVGILHQKEIVEDRCPVVIHPLRTDIRKINQYWRPRLAAKVLAEALTDYFDEIDVEVDQPGNTMKLLGKPEGDGSDVLSQLSGKEGVTDLIVIPPAYAQVIFGVDFKSYDTYPGRGSASILELTQIRHLRSLENKWEMVSA
jgi:hypothetical protein